MAYAQTDDFLELWNLSSQANERLIKKFLSDKLDMYTQLKPTTFKRFKKLPMIGHPAPRWGEQESYVHEIEGTLSGTGTTLTVTGDLFNATATRANLLKLINDENTILRRDYGGTVSLAMVTAIHASNPVLTVEAYANTSMPSDGASQKWTILGEPWKDSRDAENARVVPRTTRGTYSQIFADMFEILESRQNLDMEWIANESEHQIDMLMERMAERVAYCAIQMHPYYSGGFKNALEVEDATMAGLDWWAENLFGSGGDYENSSILYDIGGDSLDKDHLDNLSYAMLKNTTDFGQGDWVIATHPSIKQYMNDYGISYRDFGEKSKEYGFMVDKLNLKVGKSVEIIGDWYVPKDTAYLVNCSNWSWRYYKNDEPHRKRLSEDGRYMRWMISCQVVGLQGRNVKTSLGKIKNIAKVEE